MSGTRIYLDYAATTPVGEESEAAMRAVAQAARYNPSSLHAEGRRARAALDDARDRVAACLGASRDEIAFTGSGTEAAALALFGVAMALGPRGRIVTTAIEHHAVLRSVETLGERGFAIDVLPVDADGQVDPERYERALDGAMLVSIMYANNEIGAVAPIAALAARARNRGVMFHTDAVAAAPWLATDVRMLGVDLLSLSAHKIYGPKGVGALYVRAGTPLAPLVPGGGQESGRRSGTENVAGAVGLAAAFESRSAARERTAARAARLRDRLEAGIRNTVPNARFNAAGTLRLPGTASVTFAGADPQVLLARLDLAGIAVSAGSACTSGLLERSHVIAAIAPGDVTPSATIRFSIGAPTVEDDVDAVLAVLPELVGAASTPF